MMHRPWTAGAVLLLVAATAPAQAPPKRSDAAIVLEIQRLCQGDPTLSDPLQQRQALVAGLRKVPALLAELKKNFPTSQYLPAAHSLALDALMLRRENGDQTVTDAQLAPVARQLATAKDDEFRAKGKFVLLESALIQAVARAKASVPASMPATSPAAMVARAEVIKQQLASAEKFVALANELPKTGHAPLALYLGGSLYLQGGREDPAIAAFDRLTRDYPKDPYSLKALMILVRLHTLAKRKELALAAKRRCVDHFGDSEAAQVYKSDIAQVECVGKAFFLHFTSARGKKIDVTKYKGKTVLVYFYVSLLDETTGAEAIKTMSALAKLAAEAKCVLLAVGADLKEDAKKVAAALNAAKIDTPNLLDPASQVAAQYGVLMVPSVAVVSPQGKLKRIITAAEIVPAVRKALSQ